MITLYYEEKQRTKSDILYGATPHETSIYRVDSISNKDTKSLGEANTFLLLDQTMVLHSNALMRAIDNNSIVLLYNRQHKTMLETRDFYDHLSITTGAVFAVGNEAGNFLRKFQEETNHIECALEEVDFVSYPGNFSEEGFGRTVIFADGKIANYFLKYCLRRWDEESQQAGDANYIPPFDFTSIEEKANTYLTFEKYSREIIRMLDNRYRNVYVPHIPEYTILDPRSFFKANPEHLEEITKGQTEHQSAAMLKSLFEAMYDYIIDVFTTEQSVKPLKIQGNVDLFQAVAYNLSRTV